MGDPEEFAEAEALAEQIEAGTDGIELPAEMLKEEEPAKVAMGDVSLWNRVATMSVGERIKLSMRGGKEARAILSRDTNRLVRMFVLRNPKITDAEIILIARNKSADEDVIRAIAESREWMKNYQVRLALIGNPKTPALIAMRQLTSLSRRDLGQIAKSRNIPQVVATQARRLISEMKD